VEGSPAVVRRRVVVHGLVQGVWFRDSCRSEARAFGVGGFVRNREDGAVEAAFEGARPAVERLVAWCRVGPPLARVDSVELSEEMPIGERTFKIL
jgi:acylphosphatase